MEDNKLNNSPENVEVNTSYTDSDLALEEELERYNAKVKSNIISGKAWTIISKILVYLFLTIVAITILFPFYWMINTSLKSTEEYMLAIPTFYPTMGVHFENYAAAIQVRDFFADLLNTILVGVVSTGLSTVIIILAAFAFARLEFTGKNLIFTLLLATMMIPGELFTITNFATISNWEMRNTFTALILPFLISVFYIYLLRNNFKQIPDSLYYAAKVDGTSDIKYLFKVMIPLTRPTIISIVILKVMGSWNAYIWPRLVNRAGSDKYQSMRLISNWLTLGFVDESGITNYPMKMAGVVIVSTPLLILFIIFRKYIMRGVSRSGTKG